MVGSSVLAVFDFDHTLVLGDSFMPFLRYAAGWPRTAFALKDSFFSALWNAHKPETADVRMYLKGQLMKRTLAGRRPEKLGKAIDKLYAWQEWNTSIKQKLLDHAAEGHHIVIASGGLDLYLPALLKGLPYNALICTEAEVKNGILTGGMANGNCVRERKAELVAQYIRQHGPFTDSWGYGNMPHDLPMLDLLKHRIIV